MYTKLNLLFYHWVEVNVESSLFSLSACYIELYQNNVAGMIYKQAVIFAAVF